MALKLDYKRAWVGKGKPSARAKWRSSSSVCPSVLKNCLTPPTLSERRFFASYRSLGSSSASRRCAFWQLLHVYQYFYAINHLRVELRRLSMEVLYGARIYLVDRHWADCRLGSRQDYEGWRIRRVCRHHSWNSRRHSRRMDCQPPRVWSRWDDLEHSSGNPWSGDPDLDHQAHQEGSLKLGRTWLATSLRRLFASEPRQ